MRVAFLTHQFPHARMGGIGAYTLDAAAALAAAGADVHVFTFSLPDDVRLRLPVLAPRVAIHEIADPAERVAARTLPPELAAAIQSGGDAGYRLALAALLSHAALHAHASTPFDVIEAPEFEALALPALLRLAELDPAKRPAIVTQLHSGSAINRRGNNLSTTPADQAVDAMELASMLLADALCAPSRAVVRETQATLPMPREVTIIPLAVPVAARFTPPPENGPILYIGRLERLKGADVLIQAADAFLSRCGDARMLIIGPDTPTAPADSGTTSMQQWMAAKLDPALRNRVTFTGELPPSELPRYVAESSFVVVPSLFESFSLVAAGAMAGGRTVIVSDGIGTTEVVGDAGLTFGRGDASALSDAMERLWSDRALLLDLSVRAHARARDSFDPAVVVPQRLAFYRSAVEAARREKTPLQPLFESRLAQLPAPYGGAVLQSFASLTSHLCGLQTGVVLTPGQRLLRIMEHLRHDSGAAAQVLLYGAGRHTTRLLSEKHLWESRGHKVVGFIDDAPRWATHANVASADAPATGPTHLGLPVHTGAQLLARAMTRAAVCPIILSTDNFEDQFWEKTSPLRAAGIPVFRLYGKNV